MNRTIIKVNKRIEYSLMLNSAKLSRQCTILHFEYVSQGMDLTSDPCSSMASFFGESIGCERDDAESSTSTYQQVVSTC